MGHPSSRICPPKEALVLSILDVILSKTMRPLSLANKPERELITTILIAAELSCNLSFIDPLASRGCYKAYIWKPFLKKSSLIYIIGIAS